MKKLKQYLIDSKYINPLQQAFGDMVVRRTKDSISRDEINALYILAAVTLAVTSESHSCLDISAWICQMIEKYRLLLIEKPIKASEFNYTPELLCEELDRWKKICIEMKTDAISDGEDCNAQSAPLVLRHNVFSRVYLNRFYRYELNIARCIRERVDKSGEKSDIDIQKIHEASSNFHNREFEKDMQQQAVYNALRSNFTIVTGGPGRGKTTVLTDILAMELEGRPDMKIALCAPTGKAAARMKQSIEKALVDDNVKLNEDMFSMEIRRKLKDLRPQTVHRLIGIFLDTDCPKFNASNTLDFDLVAVDECSMLSLQMFSQLLSAMKTETKLILLGDENQLESVDSGKVLAELCNCQLLKTKENPVIVNRLVENFRSRENPALCQYTDEIVKEPPNPDVDGLFCGTDPRFKAIEIAEKERDKQLRAVVANALFEAGILKEKPTKEKSRDLDNTWKRADNVLQALENIETFKILCPLREGNYGVSKLNAIVSELLGMNGEYATGVPIMITQNDKVTGLSNGDLGVCFRNKVYFYVLKSDGTSDALGFNPAQLPPNERAFAMTIHKSQGSDYKHLFMCLPEQDNPVLTRELVYTGITRAKKTFTMIASRRILEKVQKRACERWSGLKILLSK